MADIEGGMFGDKEYFKPIVDAIHNMKVRTVCIGSLQLQPVACHQAQVK